MRAKELLKGSFDVITGGGGGGAIPDLKGFYRCGKALGQS